MAALLDEALACLARGCSILPVHAGNDRDKDPHSALLIRTGYHRPDPESPARLRATWKPLQTTAPSAEIVTAWFGHTQNVGMALVTGRISGRIVIDFDGDEGRAYAHSLGIRPHVRTGGGYHWHLRAPEWRVGNLVGKSTHGAPDCVDVRGDGGNAILPPTVTRKGAYVYLRDPEDLDTLDDLPLTLREALRLVPPLPAPPPMTGPLPRGDDRYPSSRILDWAIQKVQDGTLGGRNDTGYHLAWALYNNGYSHAEVLQVGQTYVSHVGHQHPDGRGAPYTLDEYRASMRTAYAAPRGEPWGYGTAEARTTPQTATQALEDVYTQLPPEDQARAAHLVAREWAATGRPLEDTIRYLRLIGHTAAPKAARTAYQDHERGEAMPGTLDAFLRARRVRYGRST